MSKHRFIAIALLTVLGGTACLCCGKKYLDPDEIKVTDQPSTGNDTEYSNPVIRRSLPDPTVIKADDNCFYLYATEDVRNVPIYKSRNLVDWQFVGTAFSESTRPTFEEDGGIWAPDINRIGDKYVLYYSMSVWGGEWTCGIGCAVASGPCGPFIDQGMMFRSNGIKVRNSIDPFYIEEGGRKYLFWGSFNGIYYAELSSDGLSLKDGAKPVQVAGTAYEGTYIHKKDGKYYLFASIGSCCEGLNSNYTTVVGRSDNLFGPYLNKKGESMMDNRHEVFIHGNDRFKGTGHNSEIVTDDSGQDWILYHGYDSEGPGGRLLFLDQVRWSDGWPNIAGDSPSVKAKRPAFGNGSEKDDTSGQRPLLRQQRRDGPSGWCPRTCR